MRLMFTCMAMTDTMDTRATMVGTAAWEYSSMQHVSQQVAAGRRPVQHATTFNPRNNKSATLACDHHGDDGTMVCIRTSFRHQAAARSTQADTPLMDSERSATSAAVMSRATQRSTPNQTTNRQRHHIGRLLHQLPRTQGPAGALREGRKLQTCSL